jgi:hypothetical protein
LFDNGESTKSTSENTISKVSWFENLIVNFFFKTWIGSLDRENFELLFHVAKGRRSVNVLKKGKNGSDHEVFIQYSFFNGDLFLDDIPSKYSFTLDLKKIKKLLDKLDQNTPP